jgi:hypothetical protein
MVLADRSNEWEDGSRAAPTVCDRRLPTFHGRPIMRRFLLVSAGLVAVLDLLASVAGAQWYYPGGYGQFGMAGWGGDPAAAYMTGLGAYARGRGVYLVDRAQARSINADTAIKWNKALREQQKLINQDRKKQQAQEEAQREEKLERRRLVNGATLNDLLDQIYDSDPAVGKASRAKAPFSPAAVREIPFDWNSEAITACIDQFTGTGSAIPPILNDAKYAEDRNAVRAAVEPALEEDAKGSVSLECRRRIHDAIAKLRAKFIKNEADYEPGYQDALNYLTTLAALNRMLNDPGMKRLLAELEEGKERTVGDLITFMNAYNLRFGRATSDRQIEIYERLVPILAAIRDELNPGQTAARSLDRSGANLRAAAKSAFGGMSWGDIEAHSREQ